MWFIILIQISFQIKIGFIILSTVHVNTWDMLNSTNWHWHLLFEKWANYEQNKTNLPYTINVTTHRPASTTDSHHMHRTVQNAVNCGTWCWTVWHALKLIPIMLPSQCIYLAGHNKGSVSSNSQSSKQWPHALWQYMVWRLDYKGTSPMLHMET